MHAYPSKPVWKLEYIVYCNRSKAFYIHVSCYQRWFQTELLDGGYVVCIAAPDFANITCTTTNEIVQCSSLYWQDHAALHHCSHHPPRDWDHCRSWCQSTRRPGITDAKCFPFPNPAWGSSTEHSTPGPSGSPGVSAAPLWCWCWWRRAGRPTGSAR